MKNNTRFVWTDAFLLGFGAMDDTHKDFVEVVDAMLTASDVSFLSCLDAFINHAETHFSEERGWMAETDFPAMQCHLDEHEAVLKSAYEVRQILTDGGELAIGRAFANELARWFPGHADYMDASLAQWMAKRRFGGTPVILRRGVAVAE